MQATLMKGRGNFLCKQDLESARSDLFADGRSHCSARWMSGRGATTARAMWPTCPSRSRVERGLQQSGYVPGAGVPFLRIAASTIGCAGPRSDSNIIVVNHALFLSDLALRRSDPNAGIIPDYDYVVFDEAHHLEDVATKTFGIEFGSRRLVNLMERIKHVKGLDIDRSRLQTLEDMNSSLFVPFLQAGRKRVFLRGRA